MLTVSESVVGGRLSSSSEGVSSSMEKSRLQKTATNTKNSNSLTSNNTSTGKNTSAGTTTTTNSESKMVIARSNTNESRLSNGERVDTMTRKNRDGYSNNRGMKERYNNNDKNLLLQRPTILSKPSPPPPPVVILNGHHSSHVDGQQVSSKDENSRPKAVATMVAPQVSNMEASSTTSSNRRVLKQDHDSSSSLLLTKPVQPTTILTPSKSQNVGVTTTTTTHGPTTSQMSKTIAKELNGLINNSQGSTISEKQQQTTVVAAAAAPTGFAQFIESIQSRLCTGTPPHMTRPARLLDDTLTWQQDSGLVEHLSDQNTDYLVVGVLGKLGSGKSTLMSMLAGSSQLFDSSGISGGGSLQHKTSGVSAFVTSERTILLDVQPLLSGSILDKTIAVADSKSSSSGGGSGRQQMTTTPHHLDFKYYENYVLMQSIELACFILSVCNVVLLTEDWFTDPNLFRVLQTAEMLMPNMNSVMNIQQQQGTPSTNLDQDSLIYEHHPHLIYVLNKSEYKSKLDVAKMKTCIENLMFDSKLIYKGSISSNESSSSTGNMLLGGSSKAKRRGESQSDAVNLVIVPRINKDESTESSFDYGFRGVSDANHTTNKLLRELLSVKRAGSSFATPIIKNTAAAAAGVSTSLSSTASQSLTEKKWFAYANKVWDTIRKSPVMAEYNRLIT